MNRNQLGANAPKPLSRILRNHRQTGNTSSIRARSGTAGLDEMHSGHPSHRVESCCHLAAWPATPRQIARRGTYRGLRGRFPASFPPLVVRKATNTFFPPYTVRPLEERDKLQASLCREENRQRRILSGAVASPSAVCCSWKQGGRFFPAIPEHAGRRSFCPADVP